MRIGRDMSCRRARRFLAILRGPIDGAKFEIVERAPLSMQFLQLLINGVHGCFLLHLSNALLIERARNITLILRYVYFIRILGLYGIENLPVGVRRISRKRARQEARRIIHQRQIRRYGFTL